MTKRLLLEKHKLNYHPKELTSFLKGEVFAPITVEVSPTARCNHKCKQCYTSGVMNSDTSPARMDSYLYFKAIKDSADFGVKSLCVCGTGEPLLHKDTPEAITYAKDRGLDVSLATNGELATANNLSGCLGDLTWLRVSMSGNTPEVYAQNQGASTESFDKILQNLRDLATIKREGKLETTLGVAFMLFENCNGEDIVPFAKAVRDTGIDYMQIKPCGDFERIGYVYEKKAYKKVLEELAEASKITTDDFFCQVKYDSFRRLDKIEEEGFTLPSKCHGLLFFTNIGSDGVVYPCTGSWYEKDDAYGSLKEQTLKEIWHSKRFKEAFDKRSITDPKICFTQCHNISLSEFLMNLKEGYEKSGLSPERYVGSIERPDPPAHINFI